MSSTDVLATVHLHGALRNLFPAAPATVRVEAATVADLMSELNSRWPGMRDRICDNSPAIRRHMTVFVDGERATLQTEIRPGGTVEIIPAISGG
ncbi:molybdopterin synthase sulfur carrier subunit [bacterium SCGC AG-212-C10]|nr:molybdopterin synthase sulfur carrier subunit [bacterium SCGC AG-212-C10]